MVDRQAVILLSDKRSGSTAFQSEMCKHSMIKHVDYSPHTYFETQHWLKSAVLLNYPSSLFLGGRAFPNYGSRRNAKTYIVDTIKGNVPDFEVPDNDKQLVFEGWDVLCRKFAQPVFFEKSPQVLAHWAAVSLMLEWAKKTTINVKFVGLVRNPLAVQNSAEKLFGTSPNSRQFDWIEAQTNLLAVQSLLPKSQFKLILYEDFIAAPGEVLRDVCQFVDIPFEDHLGASIHSNSVQKWKSDDFSMSVHSSLVTLANAFGYDIGNQLSDYAAQGVSKGNGDLSIGRSYQKFKNHLINTRLKPILLRRKWK